MKIYKVNYESHKDSNEGFSYHTSFVEAKKSLAKFRKISKDDYSESSGITKYETPISAKAIIQLLNFHGTHNNNG